MTHNSSLTPPLSYHCLPISTICPVYVGTVLTVFLKNIFHLLTHLIDIDIVHALTGRHIRSRSPTLYKCIYIIFGWLYIAGLMIGFLILNYMVNIFILSD